MKFNQKDIDAFDKFFTEVSNNSFKNINKRNEGGETILHYAVRVSDQKTVKSLIKKGADINATNSRGFTPLHSAALAKRLENVKELIRLGVDINATEGISKYSPLHFACMVGAESVIKELVKAGAKINQENKFGQTPMYYLLDNEKNKRQENL
ncbi:ankyrin repeat domain-containing protein [Wolbachia pipientis]|uniref:ankyrin repeat domain-containing protein n=1 Tax=Wolbachia pipientis TaxID=955 RepID=UPI0032D56D12